MTDDDGEDQQHCRGCLRRRQQSWSSWPTGSSWTPTGEASDIHIEPRPARKKTQIRFRRDGHPGPLHRDPSSYRLHRHPHQDRCDLDISERRKLGRQDQVPPLRPAGHRAAGGDEIAPTTESLEDVVMLRWRRLPLDSACSTTASRERLAATILKPTASSSYAAPPARADHHPAFHPGPISTRRPRWAAELVEITQRACAGADQSQGRPRLFHRDALFPACRSDVIMVGEMRDKETVIGLRPRSPDHLVFGTLHQQRGSIVRLLDGHGPFNFADALLGVLANAWPSACAANAARPPPGEDEIRPPSRRLQRGSRHAGLPGRRGRGTPGRAVEWRELRRRRGRLPLRAGGLREHCTGGYKGRLGLHELMVGTTGSRRFHPGARPRRQPAVDSPRRGRTDPAPGRHRKVWPVSPTHQAGAQGLHPLSVQGRLHRRARLSL